MTKEQRTTAWICIASVASIAIMSVARGYIDKIREERAARFATETVEPVTVVTWRGKTFRVGDVVRIYKWAGTFKPSDTGYPHEIDAGPFRTGVVLRGEKRQDAWHMRIDPAEPIQIVRVRWHRQTWKVSLKDQMIDLGEFETTIHVDHIELVPRAN